MASILTSNGIIYFTHFSALSCISKYLILYKTTGICYSMGLTNIRFSCVLRSTNVSFTSFFAASANVCNVALMRHSELSEGIDVLDSNGNVVGSSRIAAKHVSGSLTNPCVLLQM